MNTNMYDAGPTTYYFANEDEAQSARRDLVDLGVPNETISLQTKASSKSFIDSLKEFFGAESPERYSSGTLVTVRYEARNAEIERVVQRYGGRVSPEYATADETMTPNTAIDREQSAEEQRMQLREERLSVNKQAVSEGEVRLRKEVVTENQTIDVPVQREEVYIERRSLDATAHDNETDIADGEEIRVPVTHEEVSVEKHPVTTEEVVIGKRTVQEKQTVGGSVRKERARVDTEGNVTPKGSIDDE